VKAALLLLLERVNQVGRPGAQGDCAGRAAVFHLFDGEQPHVHQAAGFPAQRQGYLRAERRHGQLAVAVVERDIELVAFVATAQGQGEIDQPWRHDGGQVLVFDADLEGGDMAAHLNLSAALTMALLIKVAIEARVRSAIPTSSQPLPVSAQPRLYRNGGPGTPRPQSRTYFCLRLPARSSQNVAFLIPSLTGSKVIGPPALSCRS